MRRLGSSTCLAFALAAFPAAGRGAAGVAAGGAGRADVSIQVAEVPLGRLGPLGRVDGRHLGLFARRKGRWVAVPFQIDARTAGGRWLLDNGPRPDEDAPGAERVLVFMGRDLGEVAPPGILPDAEAGPWVALEVQAGGSVPEGGVVYLGAFGSPAPHSPLDYVDYDARADTVRAATYETTFSGAVPTVLRLARPAGGFGPDILDRMKFRGEVRLLASAVRIRRDEQSVSTRLVAYRDGPVRVLRRARYTVALPLGLRVSADVTMLFYRDRVEAGGHLKVGLPMTLADLLLLRGEAAAYLDFLDLRGFELAASTTPLRYRVSGAMGPDERVMARRGADWFALVGPQGLPAIMMTLDLEGLFARLDHELYYRDDSSFADPPESLPGQVPGVGFRLSRFNRLRSGEGVIKVIVALLDHLPPRLAMAASSLEHRPVVSVKPLGSASARTGLGRRRWPDADARRGQSTCGPREAGLGVAGRAASCGAAATAPTVPVAARRRFRGSPAGRRAATSSR